MSANRPCMFLSLLALAALAPPLARGSGLAEQDSPSCRGDEGSCADQDLDSAALLQASRSSARSANLLAGDASAARRFCNVGDHVACPGSGAMCAGDQCCPGGGGPTFPCPSASPSFTNCGTPAKVQSCLPEAAPTPAPSAPTPAPPGPPPPQLQPCSAGEHVQCPGTGVMCAGDQCCPGANGGPTFPCPSASASFTICEKPAKEENCLPEVPTTTAAATSAPTSAPTSVPTQAPTMSPTSKLAGKSVYFLPVDRFAKAAGESMAKCDNDNHWCNGTLKGLTEHLDYIYGMGFDCIWITPVVYQWQGESPSGTGCMGYWAYNLYEIDPHFGTSQDMKDLVGALHDRGMCIMYDFVGNHMGPIHSEAMVREMVPFNDSKYFHQLFRGNLTFDEYTAKTSNWPPPAQAMWSQSGAQCTQGVSCNCYKCDEETEGFGGPCKGEMVYDPESPCPEGALSPYCMPGDYACTGYNETITQQGWFYDLGDLNQSDPFVRTKQLEWISWFVTTYDIDLLRLDTAPFMSFDFLSQLQAAAQVPIIGEVTTTNMTFHAQFQENPPTGGERVLDGVLNFPLYYSALAGFCGQWFPFSTYNLTFLGERMVEQLAAPYQDLDTLGNFIDNHDVPRITKTCNHDLSRVKNAIAWTMLMKGVSIVYYGTEELLEEVRESLWDKGFNRSTDMYQYIRSLNAVRKDIALASQEVVPTDCDEMLVFTRGGKQGTWVYLNNLEASETGPVQYCGELPPQEEGHVWVDALYGVEAVFKDGCMEAVDTLPRVLVKQASLR